MPRKADPIIGDPNDPKGMIAMMEQYLEWRQVRNYAERTIGVPTRLSSLLHQLVCRAWRHPAGRSHQADHRTLSALHVPLPQAERRPAERCQPARPAGADPWLVPLDGPQQPSSVQPGQPTSNCPGWNTACRSAC